MNKEELADFKKVKCRISKATLRKLTGCMGDAVGCIWMEYYLDNWVRSNAYPPQLVSDDIFSLLYRYFPKDKIELITDTIRRDYLSAFPMPYERLEEDSSLEHLYDILSQDPVVRTQFPMLFYNIEEKSDL